MPKPSPAAAAAAAMLRQLYDGESDDLLCDEVFNEADLVLPGKPKPAAAAAIASQPPASPQPTAVMPLPSVFLANDMKILIHNLAEYWKYQIKINVGRKATETTFCKDMSTTSIENYLTNVMQYLTGCLVDSFEQPVALKSYLWDAHHIVRRYFICNPLDFPHGKNICHIFGIALREALAIHKITHQDDPKFLICCKLNNLNYTELESKLIAPQTIKTVNDMGNKWDGRIALHCQFSQPTFLILYKLREIVNDYLSEPLAYIQIQFYLIKVDKILDAYFSKRDVKEKTPLPTEQLVLEVLVTSLITMLKDNKVDLDYTRLINFCGFKPPRTLGALQVELLSNKTFNFFNFDHTNCDTSCKKCGAAQNQSPTTDAKSDSKTAAPLLGGAAVSANPSASAAALGDTTSLLASPTPTVRGLEPPPRPSSRILKFQPKLYDVFQQLGKAAVSVIDEQALAGSLNNKAENTTTAAATTNTAAAANERVTGSPPWKKRGIKDKQESAGYVPKLGDAGGSPPKLSGKNISNSSRFLTKNKRKSDEAAPIPQTADAAVKTTAQRALKLG